MLAKKIESNCPMMPTVQLRKLDPYDHLKRFYRICTVHFKRNINDLVKRAKLSYEVKQAMASLSSSRHHSDINGALNTINAAGPGAQSNPIYFTIN